jgi:hypothetical protein
MGIVILVGAQYKNTRKMGIKMKSKYRKNERICNLSNELYIENGK